MNAPIPPQAPADADAPMRFSVRHASPDAFVADGLRPYFELIELVLPADFKITPA